MARRLLGPFWIFAGTLHFVRPKMYEAIMPDYLPAHRELVLASGAAEVIGGLAALSPRTHRFARWWILGVLVAVYPANVNMAIHPDRYRSIPAWALLARLPIQFLFAAWAWAGTRSDGR